jgi:hypothetical protein
MKPETELMIEVIYRISEQFDSITVKPVKSWYLGGVYLCTIYIGITLQIGYGKTINQCCDNLLDNIKQFLAKEENPNKIIYKLSEL